MFPGRRDGARADWLSRLTAPDRTASPRITRETLSPTDTKVALDGARQAQQIDPSGIPGWIAGRCDIVWAFALIDAGQETSAQQICAERPERICVKLLTWPRSTVRVGSPGMIAPRPGMVPTWGETSRFDRRTCMVSPRP